MLLSLLRQRTSRILTRSGSILSIPKRNQHVNPPLTHDFDARPEGHSQSWPNGRAEKDAEPTKPAKLTGRDFNPANHDEKRSAIWQPEFLDRGAGEEAEESQPTSSVDQGLEGSAEDEDYSNQLHAQVKARSRAGRQNLHPESLEATVSAEVTVSDQNRFGQESFDSINLRGDSPFLDGLSDETFFTGATKRRDDAPVKMGKLREIMTRGDSQALFQYLCKESEDLDFMYSIPSITFIEILRQLQPKNEFAPMRGNYKSQGPKHYAILRNATQRYHTALRDRKQGYTDIVQRRLESGRDLGVSEYTQLLHLARAIWDGPTALDLMKEMLRNDVRPTLDCYNAYFEARIWADTSIPHERQRLRVIPHNQSMRRSDPNRIVARDIQVDGHRIEEEGIKWEITRMFSKMIEDGINPDAEAYLHLMTAQAREGDIRGMSSVLWNVYAVDTKALLEGQVEDEQRQKIVPDSPLYPTEDLLMVLAHAYGSNSNIPAAIRVVDHFSRRFGIPISPRVWGELLEWTFVLSTPRRKLRKTDGTASGLLPPHSVESLWNIMRGEPYFSEPNMLMYDLLIRHYARRDRYHEFIEHMRDAIRLDIRQHDEYEKLREDVKRIRHGDVVVFEEAGLSPEAVKLEELRTQRWLAFGMIVNWFKKLLAGRRWLHKDDRVPLWERRLLPDAVKEFWPYRSLDHVEYPMATGWVELYNFDGTPGRARDATTTEESDIIYSDVQGKDDEGQEPVTKDQDL